ncbi:bifunctional glutamate N-acetyltransferase/amino-acid acetyltransferase ArgJ [Aquifex aeolicus]|uniref:Arginine biosynthesis bifunctional protein ArgJ n=1 Tax=Aquifex aeolicus (strain VF5) TaxID=224324 RepID=ARGJ_AQUAE|nr:bifunctional glutamate N-acetyltransferase/amino-acid acetyltransferase ArgJ [Aquifex aeolicus]O67100.1 RecName: Full=Arginine biosynthesis bifunctional protein ArgJ; Includes: RecName: Full=Glutamate N-acetyltransferase; AltName: Full=Ornithine acetyltransferase; Short=OATase; AltName: Full=Ornithine transacetylase; Includes: RecName: Full=Amino-acid acetyltransferase; AltName: Full=N-acetylglutamate synthase; Short=AGSase; Contains: RecName: Full=Arginine biosynthesis bifunctional protein Arg
MAEILMGVGNAGLKESGNPDILVVYLPYPCTASFVFTDNYFKAGSVIYSERIARDKERIRAFVVNSGNANCGTGEEGIKHAEMMAEKVAQILDIPKDEVFVFSTGIIGKYLPIENVLKGIEQACSNLELLDLKRASEVISTTDRFPKYDFAKAGEVETFGFAKGAGMIHPSMATMLAFVFTNANLEYLTLKRIHESVTEKTFNSITVDGCESTNDAFGIISLGEVEADPETVEFELLKVSESLAKQIVADGEGATKIIRVNVRSAITEIKAREIAEAIANSLLVKTAVFGRDPNWGRIAAAAGSTEFPIDPFKLEIYVGGYLLYDGKPHDENLEKAKKHLIEDREVDITVELNEGEYEWVCYSSDIGYDYIKLNAEYTT